MRVFDLLPRRVLVTRESARSIAVPLALALERGQGEIALDFSGIEAVTPSFVDEVLNVVDESRGSGDRASLRVRLLNPPTRLSRKFSAVGRGHGLRISESADGAWTIVADP
jgi:hypothetical protein